MEMPTELASSLINTRIVDLGSSRGRKEHRRLQGDSHVERFAVVKVGCVGPG